MGTYEITPEDESLSEEIEGLYEDLRANQRELDYRRERLMRLLRNS